MTTQTHPRASRFSLLTNRDFRLLFTAQSFSSFGDALTNLTLIAIVNQLIGSTAAIATLTILIALPTLTIGLLAGSLVDRLNRKRIMVVSDLLRGVLVLGFMLVSSRHNLWLMYTFGFVQAAIGTFFIPARMALMTQILSREQLLEAASFSQATYTVMGFMGTALAGVLVGLNQPHWLVFGMDSLTFLGAALLACRVRTSGKVDVVGKPTDPRAVLRGVGEGISVVVKTPILRTIMVTVAIAMLGFGAMNILMVPFLTQELKIPLTWFGALQSANAVALVIAGALMTLLASRVKTHLLIGGSLLLMGMLTFSTSLAQNIWVMMALSFLLTFATTPINISVGVLIQTRVPNEILGRVGSALGVVIQSSSLLSMAFAGILGSSIGIRNVFVVTALLSVLAGLYALVAFRHAGPRTASETA